MGCLENIKETFSKAEFTPLSLLTLKGGLHICQVGLSLVTFILAAFKSEPYHTFWNYSMFTWAFCPIITILITLIEMFLLHIPIGMFFMDWSDFSTGMTMSSTLMTLASAVIYANFYACNKCVFDWIVCICALLTFLLYAAEVVKDKILDRQKGSYLSALPGFWKVLEAFVSCMIFISLTGYHGKPFLILCIVAYAIPFPIILLLIVTNMLKILRTCLPFNLDKFTFIFLAVCVGLYVFAAICWPSVAFKNNPRPSDCPGSSCIWAIEFIVTFMTYVNLALFIVDLVLTLLGICGFSRR